MVELRFIESPSNPHFKHVKDNEEEYIYKIHIHSSKGTYSLSNPRPPQEGNQMIDIRPNRSDDPFMRCLWVRHDSIKIEKHWEFRYCVYHPLKHCYVYMGQEFDATTLKQVHDDVIEWIRKQPPKMDQLRKAYEEERVGVQEFFEESILKNGHDSNTPLTGPNTCLS